LWSRDGWEWDVSFEVLEEVSYERSIRGWIIQGVDFMGVVVLAHVVD
jgi:hypothetical protein